MKEGTVTPLLFQNNFSDLCAFQEPTAEPWDSHSGARVLEDRSRAQNNPALPEEREKNPLGKNI